MELYKKYRPADFEEIFGNESIVSSLKNKIKKDELPHFIIFAGPPGTGKTTLSRILKNKLEIRDLDFVEINAANANGVEVARSVAEKCLYKPLGKSKNRMWLFDEAHRLTSACLAAMLKMLEDCPSHAYFIFATSEFQKLPDAIRSRATIFNLRPLDDEKMRELLASVCEKEEIEIPEKAIDKIVEVSLGQSRNALVALDTIKDLSPKKMEEALEKFAQQENKCYELLQALLWKDGKWSTIAKILKDFVEDPEQTRRYLMTCACNQLKDPAKEKNHDSCFQLAFSMRKPFYDNGMNDLIFACRDFWNEVYSK